MLHSATRDDLLALGRLGAAHQCDAESVPTARALGRYLSEPLHLPTTTLPRAHRLTPIDLGRIALAGRAQVPCVRRPTVAVFTAGHGLRPPGQALDIDERFDGARAFLMGRLLEAGIEPVAWPILSEVLERATPMLEDAAQAFDLVLVCGPTHADGVPVLASAIDAQSPSAIVCIDERLGQGGFVAVAAAFGIRQPRALMLCLPDELEGLSEHWNDTAGRLIAAMQGVSESPVSNPQGQFDSQGEDIDVHEAARLHTLGATLIDVREADEVALGHASRAVMLPLSALERGATLPAELPRPLLLICASGTRSQRAAALLKTSASGVAYSIRGGTAAWAQAGLPMSQPAGSASVFSADELERYDRHLRLAEVGPEGQRRLRDSRVLVVGAGGLGSPAAFYLAAAGVGTLVLVDDDRVDRSNLQRQILHVDASVGTSKVQSARERLLALNPSIVVEAIEARIDSQNIETLLAGADVVIDGSDNFPARYLLNSACVQRGMPLVYGAVERFTGQASVFDAGRRRGEAPCYRCLFPEPPGADEAPNCAEAGVLGVLPGLIGIIQATETLKLLLGRGEPLIGRVLTVDALTMQFRSLSLKADPDCPECGAAATFTGYEAVTAFCVAR